MMNRVPYSTADLDSRTVTLSEREVGDAIRLLTRLTGRTESSDRSRPVERAREAFRQRRKRVAVFGNEMFGEPAWDILLILYIEEDIRRHKLGMLANYTGAAPTTVLRWIGYLEERELVTRKPHPTDARSVFVELSEKGRALLNSYFSETLTEVR